MSDPFIADLKAAFCARGWVTGPSRTPDGSFHAGPIRVRVSLNDAGKRLVEGVFGRRPFVEVDGLSPFEPYRRIAQRESPETVASRLMTHFDKVSPMWHWVARAGNSGQVCSVCRSKNYARRHVLAPHLVGGEGHRLPYGTVCPRCLMQVPGPLQYALLGKHIGDQEGLDPLYPHAARLSLCVRAFDKGFGIGATRNAWVGNGGSCLSEGKRLIDWMDEAEVADTDVSALAVFACVTTGGHAQSFVEALKTAPVSHDTREQLSQAATCVEPAVYLALWPHARRSRNFPPMRPHPTVRALRSRPQ